MRCWCLADNGSTIKQFLWFRFSTKQNKFTTKVLHGLMDEEPNSVPRMGKRMELMESLVKRMEAPVSWQVFSKILMEASALSNLEYICVTLVGEKRCCMGWPRKPTGAFFSLPYASMTFPSLSPGSSRQAMAPTQTNRSTWVWPIDGGKKQFVKLN